MHPDTCTLEHLFERQVGPRARTPSGQKRWTIACRQCNHDRGAAHSRKMNDKVGIERARIRSVLGHLFKPPVKWRQIFVYDPPDLGVLMDMGREAAVSS